MNLLDEDGRLFGVINAVDAIAVLLAIGVVIASVVVFVPELTRTEEETTVRFQVNGAPGYVADSISTGPVPSNDDVVRVMNKSTRPTGNNSTSSVTLYTRTRITMNNGETYLGGQRIYVGRTVTLDLGNVVVEATVTELPMS